MGDREKTALTKLELQIMQVIWKLGTSSVNDVQEGLSSSSPTPPSRPCSTSSSARASSGASCAAVPTSTAPPSPKPRPRATPCAISWIACSAARADELVMSLIQSRQIDPKRIAEFSRRVQQQAEEEEEKGGGA